jgi:hypothetical protein
MSVSVSELAEKLHTNLYGPKKDDIILQITMNTNISNRISISQYYKAAYEKSLFEDIKSKISGDFGYCAAQMFLTPLEFCLHHLKIGLKKGNECAFEMLTSKTPEELKIIENAYRRSTGNELKDDIKKVFSGSVGNNLLNLFDTPRLSNPKPRKNECEKYANKLIEKEPKNWVDDESLFKEIFIQRSPEELILIARFYLKSTGNNLLDVIEKKIKGKQQMLLKEILYNNIMPHELFAEKIYLAIKGAGTNEEILTRALVSRCELDMPLMREIYQFKYNISMKDDIIGDTSGSYQTLCVSLSEK